MHKTHPAIGNIPLPLYVVLAVIVCVASRTGRLPADMVGGFAAALVFGVLLGHLGNTIPVVKDIGGAAILCIYAPSALVHYHVIDGGLLAALTALVNNCNFLYFYISALVCGSILGMNRTILVQGFIRMFGPIVAGTFAGIAAGMLAGLACGQRAYDTFFFVIAPLFAGGFGEGILPMTAGYSDILHVPQGDIIPALLSAGLLGNLIAIVAAGLLKKLGERRPALSGNGLLMKTRNDAALLRLAGLEKPAEYSLMGAGMLIACCFFVFGSLLSLLTGFPGAALMIISAAAVKVCRLLPERMERGTWQYYRFIATNLTYPLMVSIGAVSTPWGKVVAALNPSLIAICLAAVAGMIAIGFVVGRLLDMYPVEASVVTACHSGMGGTGAVAILTAADRLGLMPFAQISTRIGGALTVIATVMLLKVFQ